jgi:hypothetical protein
VTLPLVLASVLTLITLGYGLACAAAPFTRCRRCGGHGRKTGCNGRPTRTLCRPCDGTGIQVRIGRRAWTWIAREYRDGTR